LSATGEQNRPEDIDAAGKELGVKIPSQLRALLLNYNLGHLKGGPFILPRESEPRNWAVDAIVCMVDPEFDDELDSHELVDQTINLRENWELPSKYVFIAKLFDECAVISCQKASTGTVHYWDGLDMVSYKLADTLGDFLAMLIPKTWPLTDDDFSPKQ
jgi:hypothetical protein